MRKNIFKIPSLSRFINRKNIAINRTTTIKQNNHKVQKISAENSQQKLQKHTDFIETTATPHATVPMVPIEEVLKLDKGPSKPPKDVPAATVFGRMFLATTGALKTATDRAIVNARAGNGKIHRAIGDQNNEEKDRVKGGNGSSGVESAVAVLGLDKAGEELKLESTPQDLSR
ncbi:hypothetical protein A4A49_26894 [Nicotiana attenuata]|uniref:Uncharacterized protein n=1 Tax=Nicotiana attenuata TaxID=49451 RepID=A0A314L1U8_NICAT|nr:hypothetical protein A4A49_26894 [Nicotiana attenuata]